MAVPEPPHGDGLNFFIPWGLLEWAIGAISAVVGSIILWVLGLGKKSDRHGREIGILSKEIIRLESKVDKLESTLEEKLAEAERARAALKEELLDVLRDLPTRVFIESQMQQLTQRIDGLIDARWQADRRRTEG